MRSGGACSRQEFLNAACTEYQRPKRARDSLLRDLSDPITVFEWHGAEVVALPAGATVIAKNEACAVQAFRYGACAYGVQFHIELTRDTVADWAQHIRPVMNEAELARQVDEAYPQLYRLARNAYDNLKALWADAPA